MTGHNIPQCLFLLRSIHSHDRGYKHQHECYTPPLHSRSPMCSDILLLSLRMSTSGEGTVRCAHSGVAASSGRLPCNARRCGGAFRRGLLAPSLPRRNLVVISSTHVRSRRFVAGDALASGVGSVGGATAVAVCVGDLLPSRW